MKEDDIRSAARAANQEQGKLKNLEVLLSARYSLRALEREFLETRYHNRAAADAASTIFHARLCVEEALRVSGVELEEVESF